MTGLVGDTDVVAVYTTLSQAFVAALVSVYPEVNGPPPGKEVLELQGMAQGSINTTYRVRLSDGSVWFLRVNEGKPFERLMHERDLLNRLDALHAALGVVTPRMANSVAGSAFFALEGADGERRWACIFPQLPGRELGVFEVEAEHARQVGAFLARAHRGLRRWRSGPNPYGVLVVAAWFKELTAHPATADRASRLASAFADVRRHRKAMPRGVIHGDLFIDNSRWDTGAGPVLRAVFDWEMAGRDHLALDVAITICAWCYRREGDRMVWRPDVAAALVDGYQSERPLSDAERRGLPNELRLAAIRFAASRLRDFGLPRPDGDVAERRILDPADFVERLDHLEGIAEQALLADLGLASPTKAS